MVVFTSQRIVFFCSGFPCFVEFCLLRCMVLLRRIRSTTRNPDERVPQAMRERVATATQHRSDVAVALIREAKAAGAAVVGIFHDADVRDRVSDRLFNIEPASRQQGASRSAA